MYMMQCYLIFFQKRANMTSCTLLDEETLNINHKLNIINFIWNRENHCQFDIIAAPPSSEMEMNHFIVHINFHRFNDLYIATLTKTFK